MKGESSNKTAERNAFCSIVMTPTIIATLQKPYQRVLHLHYIEKRSYASIAKDLSMPEGTVKSLVNRGIKMLQTPAVSHEDNRANGYGYKSKQRVKVVPSEFIINTLREPYQTAIRLHYLDKLTYGAMAKLLRLPEGTVKSRVSRGMKYLFGALFQNGDDDIA